MVTLEATIIRFIPYSILARINYHNYLVFDIIRHIMDPEHPLTLEQLKVVSLDQIEVENNRVYVRFTPTIPHCSSASLIGLTLLAKLKTVLPSTCKVNVAIENGTHNMDRAITK